MLVSKKCLAFIVIVFLWWSYLKGFWHNSKEQLIVERVLIQPNQFVVDNGIFIEQNSPLWSVFDSNMPIKIVYNSSKDYALFVLNNETRAIKSEYIAFDRIRSESGAWIERLVVPNITEFLWHWNRGRFIECHQELEVPKNSSDQQKIPLRFVKKMSDFQGHAAKHNVTAFLMFGSLLGWRRECSIIPHTYDVDFGMLAIEHSEAFVSNLKQSWEFPIVYMANFGTYMDLGIHLEDGFIDLYYVNEDKERNNGSFISILGFAHRRRLQHNYPEIREICSVDLLDYLMFVPCNVDAVVQADYGENWRLPIYDWDDESTAMYHNLEARELYTDEEWSHVFQVPISFHKDHRFIFVCKLLASILCVVIALKY